MISFLKAAFVEVVRVVKANSGFSYHKPFLASQTEASPQKLKMTHEREFDIQFDRCPASGNNVHKMVDVTFGGKLLQRIAYHKDNEGNV